MLPTACLLCIAALLSGGGAQNLDNVDIEEPQLRVSPDRPNPTLSDVNDYFGWAAIFHDTQATVDGESLSQRVGKTSIIIGAPFGTFPGGLGYPDDFGSRVDKSGLVYNCPLGSSQCEGVRGNTAAYLNDQSLSDQSGQTVSIETPVFPSVYSEGRLFDQAPNAEVNIMGTDIVFTYDNKEEQLLGSTLYSTGEQFMACAPRYQFDFTESNTRSQPIGICYSSGRDLQDFEPSIPCNVITSYSPSENTGQGFCLAGFSAIINNDNFVIGAPGSDLGRGNLWASPSGGNFMSAANPSTTPPDQYQGFQSVGAFMTVASNSGSLQNLVTSVPKAGTQYTGSLSYYQSTATITSRIDLACGGTQMAEFFGYSLAAIDVNNDNFDEISVGAPMYTDYSTNSVERGRVYLFRNNGGALMCDPSDVVVIDGPSSLPRSSRFGSSLVSLGDIDMDGYNDFAVGAPYYTTSTGNTGAVFIYYGRSNISAVPEQVPFVITADTMADNIVLNGNLRTFGWSLSSGHDVDSNGYYDLLIGAYESQSVFVLRTLPVADVTVYFTQLDAVDLMTQTSFNLDIQASFSGESVIDGLMVEFDVVENGINRNRVFFDSGRTLTTGTGTFVFVAQNTNTTTSIVVYPVAQICDLANYNFEITLRQIVRSDNGRVSGDQTITPLDAFPKIRQGGQTSTMVPIRDVCGIDGCQSDLMFQSVTPMDLTVIAADEFMGRMTEELVMVISNLGPEPACVIDIRFSNIPTYITAVSTTVGNCDRLDGDVTTCHFEGNTLVPNDVLSVPVQFIYNPSGLIGNETPSAVDLLLIIPPVGGNLDNNAANNAGTLRFVPTAIADLFVTMSFVPNPAEYTAVSPADPAEEGISAFETDVDLRVIVNNTGPSTVQMGTLNIYLPSANSPITGDETFLYPHTIRGTGFSCGSDNLDPNGYLGIMSGRRRRSARAKAELRQSIARESSLRNKRQTNPVNFDLDCTPGSPTRVNCTMFSCTISNIRREALTVTIISSLDERFYSTLDEDARRMFRLRAYAEVTIDNDYIEGDNLTDNSISGDLLIREFVSQPTDPEDLLHAILWPVLGGVLLLIVLIIVLYFCGFFRRKRKGGVDIEGVDDFPEETKGPPPRESMTKEPFDIKED